MRADEQKGDGIEVAGRRLVNSYGSRFRVVPLGNLSLGQETAERSQTKPERNKQTSNKKLVQCVGLDTHKQIQEKVEWVSPT